MAESRQAARHGRCATLSHRGEASLEWYAVQLFGKIEHDWYSDTHREQAHVARAEARTWEKTKDELLQMNGSNRELYNMFVKNGGWAAYPSAVVFRIDVRDLSGIDTVRGTFMASFYTCAEFFCPDLAAEMQPALNVECESHVQAPHINVRNSLSTEKIIRDNTTITEVDMAFVRSRSGKTFRSEAWVLNEEFSETFELKQFPFDVQECTVYFSLISNKKYRQDSPPWFWMPVSGLFNMRSTLSEWELLRPTMQVWDATEGKPVFAFRMRVQRRWQWYVTNHMAVVGILSTMTFSVFSLVTLPSTHVS